MFLLVVLQSICVAGELPFEYSFSVAAAPHYATGSANLDDATNLIGGTLSIDLEAQKENVKAYVQSQAQWPDVGEKVQSSHLLRQSYLDIEWDEFDLRLGRQLIIWGRADRFNPTDSLTPTNFTFLTTETQGQRFGATGVVLRYFPTYEYTILGTLLPFFESSDIPMGLFSSLPIDKNTPNVTITNPQYGLKIDHSGRGLDASMSYYHGYSTSPGFTPRIIGVLDQRNPQIDVVGGDFAFTRGQWGLRGEVAYRLFDNDSFLRGIGPHSEIYSVLGAERTFGESNQLLVQWMFKVVPGKFFSADDVPEFVREVAIVNDVVYQQFDRVQNGLSTNLRSEWFNSTLTTELAGALWFKRGSYVLRPKLEYALSDQWHIAGTLTLYGGPKESTYGFLNKNNQLFIELSRSFF